jgi:hypothetical protein
MGDHLNFVDGLLARLDGPMSLRLLLQPLMALFFAYRDGRRDAQAGRPPYFWALFSDAEHRPAMLQSGWKSVGKVFVIAILLDLIFQYLVFQNFRPIGAVVAGLVLAIVPYVLLRGPVNRLAR